MRVGEDHRAEALPEVAAQQGEIGRLARIVLPAGARERDRELLDDAARARGEEQDAVGEDEGLVDTVGHEEHRRAGASAGQALEFGLHQLARLGVERGKGLVHEQELGFRGEGAGERGTLLHAAGELARPGVRDAGEADPGEDAVGPGGTLGLGKMGKREGDVGATVFQGRRR